MRIDNSFTVGQSPERLWATLLDVETIVSCMPGAELTEIVDDRTWEGTLHAAFGPVSMSFAGTVSMQERDDDAKRVVLRAKGRERKGKGAGDATVTAWLEPGDAETTVMMQADITLSGAAAQLSRGLLPEISRKLTQQFADCLHDTMASAGEPEVAEASPKGAAPVGGIALATSAVWSSIAGFFRRLFGGRGSASG